LTVNVGRGSNPSGFVLGKPLWPLGVGVTHVLRVPVTIPALTFGDYSVRAQVITDNGNVAVVVGATSYPWGLFVIGMIFLIVVSLLIWARHRRRSSSSSSSSNDLPAADSDHGGTATETAEIPTASPV
jgi:hypothetical protein